MTTDKKQLQENQTRKTNNNNNKKNIDLQIKMEITIEDYLLQKRTN